MKPTRRKFLSGAASVVALTGGGTALSAGPVYDPAFANLLAIYSSAKAKSDASCVPFDEAEGRHFAVAREHGRAVGDAAWIDANGPALEAVKDEAEDACMAAEDAIRDYPVKSFADLVAKARTMEPVVLVEEGEALARDILALAGG